MSSMPPDPATARSGVAPPDFHAAAQSVLQHLHERTGFDLWMVARAEGDDAIALAVRDKVYGLKEGDVLHWADGICARHVCSPVPRVVPRADGVRAYVDTPVLRPLKVNAFATAPLCRGNGSLFGALCALHPVTLPDSATADQPLIELMARLLGGLLDAELRLAHEARRARHAEDEAQRDPLTGIANRRGFERFLDAEEVRCRNYGHNACVVSIDVDGLKRVNDTFGHNAGDDLLRRAATALMSAARGADIVARTGGDEFAVIGVECDSVAADVLTRRLRNALGNARVGASLGVAVRSTQGSLQGAWTEADRVMYLEKKKHQRVPPPRPPRDVVFDVVRDTATRG
jgi:diguanylate cyclase (GGDEF)-like protein